MVDQKRLYDADLKANGGKPSGKVAYPGTSWHGTEPALALDIGNRAFKAYSDKFLVHVSRLRQPINRWGLMLPLNSVDSRVVENWHIQPVETNGIAAMVRPSWQHTSDLAYGRMPLLRPDDTNKLAVTELQRMLSIKVDGSFGPKTRAAVLNLQDFIGIVADGIVGTATWSALYKK